jgi:hypothetical protein
MAGSKLTKPEKTMEQSEKQQFVKLITDVLAFYKQDTSTFAITVWWAACQKFDIEQVRRALTQHAMDPDRGVFAPKPADLVRQLEGTSGDRAMLAWGKVLDAAQRVGAYTDVVFDDPAIHAAVEDLGGWPKLCRTETKDLGYLQHRFCESHKAYTSKGAFDYPRRLGGDRSSDDVYAKRGLPPPAPALVGDQEMARRVYSLGTVGGKTNIAHNAADLVRIAR